MSPHPPLRGTLPTRGRETATSVSHHVVKASRLAACDVMKAPPVSLPLCGEGGPKGRVGAGAGCRGFRLASAVRRWGPRLAPHPPHQGGRQASTSAGRGQAEQARLRRGQGGREVVFFQHDGEGAGDVVRFVGRDITARDNVRVVSAPATNTGPREGHGVITNRSNGIQGCKGLTCGPPSTDVRIGSSNRCSAPGAGGRARQPPRTGPAPRWRPPPARSAPKAADGPPWTA